VAGGRLRHRSLVKAANRRIDLGDPHGPRQSASALRRDGHPANPAEILQASPESDERTASRCCAATNSHVRDRKHHSQLVDYSISSMKHRRGTDYPVPTNRPKEPSRCLDVERLSVSCC
jgi:hypothetical protein